MKLNVFESVSKMKRILKLFYDIKFIITDPKGVYRTLKVYSFSMRGMYKELADYLYYLHFHKTINWEHPEDINQWINFLIFNSDTTQWSVLADKYEVKNFLKNKGFEEILIPLLGKWENPDDISFDNLPNDFVIKLNNSSGDAIFIKDKNTVDLDKIKLSLKKRMHIKYGKSKAEPYYLRIKPIIIAEKYMDASKQPVPSESLIDYKFWCFNGKVISCMVCANRKKNIFQIAIYSVIDGWKDISKGNVLYSNHKKPMGMTIPRPKSLDKMIEFASKISKGHPQMRVDLYEVDEIPYFGEITMTSFCGRINYFSSSYLKELGDYAGKAYMELNGN